MLRREAGLERAWFRSKHRPHRAGAEPGLQHTVTNPARPVPRLLLDALRNLTHFGSFCWFFAFHLSLLTDALPLCVTALALLPGVGAQIAVRRSSCCILLCSELLHAGQTCMGFWEVLSSILPHHPASFLKLNLDSKTLDTCLHHQITGNPAVLLTATLEFGPENIELGSGTFTLLSININFHTAVRFSKCGELVWQHDFKGLAEMNPFPGSPSAQLSSSPSLSDEEPKPDCRGAH